MKLRSASLDDLHLETLLWIDDLDLPSARRLRVAVNTLYRIHRSLLALLIGLIGRCSKRRGLA